IDSMPIMIAKAQRSGGAKVAREIAAKGYNSTKKTYYYGLKLQIESLFNWIEEKTGIQTASKVRSTQGLLVHVFGKLAAAMLMLTPAFNS
ncbi:MAG: hypothetical protein D3914_11570, partial [Candidatus Electrothrix sp. LOE2]|nr:hypothetical protein [Candidatus Electrothrix sp. LOE2]